MKDAQDREAPAAAASVEVSVPIDAHRSVRVFPGVVIEVDGHAPGELYAWAAARTIDQLPEALAADLHDAGGEFDAAETAAIDAACRRFREAAPPRALYVVVVEDEKRRHRAGIYRHYEHANDVCREAEKDFSGAAVSLHSRYVREDAAPFWRADPEAEEPAPPASQGLCPACGKNPCEPGCDGIPF